MTIRVDYYAEKFGYVGWDVFTDEMIVKTLPNIAKTLSKQIDEEVVYQVTFL